MCFYLAWSNSSDKRNNYKIAEEDISCWKVLNKNCSPLYGGTDMTKATHRVTNPYKKGKTNPKQVICIEKGFMINEGYHSYISEKTAQLGYENHADYTCKIKKFVIPKGTKYYENSSEYVSETIIML